MDTRLANTRIIPVATVLILVALLITAGFGQEQAPAPEFALGDYIQLGTYEGNPILWRCADQTEEYGTLLLSDTVLCKKAFDAQDLNEGSLHRFGSNFWEESNLRAWLNSTAPAGEVVWPGNNPPTTENVKYGEGYAEEKGFLHSDNFTEAERSLMKTVSQWTLLAQNKVELAANGRSDIYKPHISHQAFESVVPSPAIQELGEKYPYNGAMYKVADTIFLLDGMQAYRLLENFGTANANTGYWLRSPVTYTTDMARDLCDCYIPADVSESLGVRPAFYLNETRAVVAGGSGSAEDPYVLDSRKVGGIAVFHNGSEVLAGQEPVMENDRVLLPLRAIFEATGAEVEWEEETQTVTARTCMGTVIM